MPVFQAFQALLPRLTQNACIKDGIGIDYACGAGHFLTEAVEAINFFTNTNGNNDWARDHIYGIEKDYRLARVAKISLFMNGAGEGNIIFGDGLENAPDKGVSNGTFGILVANPPYSVKDFKQHLQLKNNSFVLLDSIRLNGGEIETLFVERIAQLLKPQGVAGVILPSSILSNDSASYTGAREQILQNFYIRAIASFGSKTFGATGTNTVVLFLEKFNEPPKQIDLSYDTVDAVFNGGAISDWLDKEILEAYVNQIDVDLENYFVFLKKAYSVQELRADDYFKMYAEEFVNSSEAKTLMKTKAYKNKSAEEQTAEYTERLYTYAHNIEKEKLFYFSLVYRQTTVIITAPADNTAQKEFLGYDWSNRKGNEGIKIITPGGKLYDDSNRAAEGTLASAIRSSFNSDIPVFREEQSAFAKIVQTKDMLDFLRANFTKELKLNTIQNRKLHSVYPLVKLISICQMNLPKTVTKNLADDTLVSFVEMASVSNDGYIQRKVDRPLSEVRTGSYTYFGEGDIIIAKITPCMENGKCAIATGLTNNIGFGSSEFHTFRCDKNKILPKFLFLFLNQNFIRDDAKQSMTGASGHRRVPATFYENLSIPLPPIDVQNEIVAECEKIEKEYNTTRMSIENYRKKIEDLFNELDVISNRGGYRLSLADSENFDVSIGKRVLNKQLIPDGSIPVYSANVIEPFGYIDELLITDFSHPSVLWGIDGDWMTSFMPENAEFYPTDHCGVLRCKTDAVNPRYLAHILEREGKRMGFSRSYRASMDRVKGITFVVCDRKTQDDMVVEINTIEAQIRDAEEVLNSFNGKISDILNYYLK